MPRIVQLSCLLMLVTMHSTGCRHGSAELKVARSIGDNPVDQVMDTLESRFLKTLNPDDIRERMSRQLKILFLVDEFGQVKLPKHLLQRYPELAGSILPPQIVEDDLRAYLRDFRNANRKNKYLADIVAALQISDDLARKLDKEGVEVFSDLLAYGLVLENLAKAMRQNVELISYLRTMWARSLIWTGAIAKFTPFEMEKLPILNALADGYQKHQGAWAQKGIGVPYDFGFKVVPDNIMSATKWDKIWGNEANVAVGQILCSNPPGASAVPRVNGAGPTAIAEDDIGMLFSPPNPEKWADLYLVWNLDFVSSYPNWPYFYMKLLTPFVSRHHGNSTAFLHNRGLALFVHAYFLWLGRSQNDRSSRIRWDSHDLYYDFGKLNKHAAHDYMSSLEVLGDQEKWVFDPPKTCARIEFSPQQRHWTIK